MCIYLILKMKYSIEELYRYNCIEEHTVLETSGFAK